LKNEKRKKHKKGTQLLKKTKEYVFLYEKGVAKLQRVKTGIQNNMYIEITKGVKEGQEVITAPYRLVSKTLKNGEKVKKVNKKELFTVKKK